jgi:hypothetical protein
VTKLIEIEWPLFQPAVAPPKKSAQEFLSRIDILRSTMEKRGLTHLIVYGDREHSANLGVSGNWMCLKSSRLIGAELSWR